MRAIRQHEFGPPDVLRLEEVPDPEPGPGQVRIAVAAAGVHLLDTAIRAGRSGGPFPLPELPMTPGREVAGVVDAVGQGVDRAWSGRRVVAHLGQASGGYAELAVREVANVHALPDGLGFAAAVAMVGTGRTAMAILEVADLGAGDTVLVLAAAGGIGALLVQAARNAGATAVGAAGGSEKVARVRELGAAQAVDYTRERWAEQVGPVSVVLDGVGGAVGRAALELLAPGGRIVLFGWSSGEPTVLSSGDLLRLGISASAAVGPRVLNRPGGLAELEAAALAAAASGDLTPLVDQPFPLADAASAHAALESRRTTGKVVLAPEAV